jgi:hypothetical protein
MFHCECHYECDVCGRELDAKNDQRFELRISACGDEADRGMEDDRDYLEEIDVRLICARDYDDELDGDQDEEITYDLCPECRQNFSLDRLGRRATPSLDFSPN